APLRSWDCQAKYRAALGTLDCRTIRRLTQAQDGAAGRAGKLRGRHRSLSTKALGKTGSINRRSVREMYPRSRSQSNKKRRVLGWPPRDESIRGRILQNAATNDRAYFAAST